MAKSKTHLKRRLKKRRKQLTREKRVRQQAQAEEPKESLTADDVFSSKRD